MTDTTMSRQSCSRIHPHVEHLPPVWLFSDDLEEFFQLLQSFGDRVLVETNTFQMFISPVEKGTSQEQTPAEQQGKEDSTGNTQGENVTVPSPSKVAERGTVRVGQIINPILRWIQALKCSRCLRLSACYESPQVKGASQKQTHAEQQRKEDSADDTQKKGASQKQTSTEQQRKEDPTVNPQEAARLILARPSPSSLYAEMPDRRISLLASPTKVELRWICDWLPEEEESYAIPQIRDFLHTKRHLLFFLGQRNWQLWTALLAIALFLRGLNLEGWSYTLTMVLGGSLGTLVLVWATAGIFMPNHSHLTLCRISRTKFKEYLVWGCAAVLALWVTFLVGMTVD